MPSASAISVSRPLDGRDSAAKYASSDRRSWPAITVRRRRRPTAAADPHADRASSLSSVSATCLLSATASHTSSAGRSTCMLRQLSVSDSKRQMVLWLSGVDVGRRSASAAPTSACVAPSRIRRSRNCSANWRSSSLTLDSPASSWCSVIVDEHSTTSPPPVTVQPATLNSTVLVAELWFRKGNWILLTESRAKPPCRRVQGRTSGGAYGRFARKIVRGGALPLGTEQFSLSNSQHYVNRAHIFNFHTATRVANYRLQVVLVYKFGQSFYPKRRDYLRAVRVRVTTHKIYFKVNFSKLYYTQTHKY